MTTALRKAFCFVVFDQFIQKMPILPLKGNKLLKVALMWHFMSRKMSEIGKNASNLVLICTGVTDLDC